MKVLIDGKEIPCQNDVKVIYEDEVIGFNINDHRATGGLATFGELRLTLSREGMIVDTFKNGGLYKMGWISVGDLIEKTH